MIKVEIIDNGIGVRRAAAFPPQRHDSFATFATKRRIALIKKSLNLDISLSMQVAYVDKHDTGTHVTLIIPIK